MAKTSLITTQLPISTTTSKSISGNYQKTTQNETNSYLEYHEQCYHDTVELEELYNEDVYESFIQS